MKLRLISLEMSSSWNFPAQASPSYEVSSSSEPELGHFNFWAETELKFFWEVQSNFQISTSIMIITNSNQLHDNLYEFI